MFPFALPALIAVHLWLWTLERRERGQDPPLPRAGDGT